VDLARFWYPDPQTCRRQRGKWVEIMARFPGSGIEFALRYALGAMRF
jgi:hypothetical protein